MADRAEAAPAAAPAPRPGPSTADRAPDDARGAGRPGAGRGRPGGDPGRSGGHQRLSTDGPGTDAADVAPGPRVDGPPEAWLAIVREKAPHLLAGGGISMRADDGPSDDVDDV